MIYQTEETRNRIIDAARELFMSDGFFETQMKDVAEKVGISRTSLYRYYRDKLDLGMAILEVAFDEIAADQSWRSAASPYGGTALGRLDCFLRCSMAAPKFNRLRLFVAEFDAYFSGCRIPADFIDRLRTYIDSNLVVLDLLEQGIADGSIRPDIDPHLAHVTISNAVTALLQRLLLRGHALIELREGELDRISDEHIRFLLEGLRNRPEH
jgi:AcrR family transcriptional regulator